MRVGALTAVALLMSCVLMLAVALIWSAFVRVPVDPLDLARDQLVVDVTGPGDSSSDAPLRVEYSYYGAPKFERLTFDLAIDRGIEEVSVYLSLGNVATAPWACVEGNIAWDAEPIVESNFLPITEAEVERAEELYLLPWREADAEDLVQRPHREAWSGAFHIQGHGQKQLAITCARAGDLAPRLGDGIGYFLPPMITLANDTAGTIGIQSQRYVVFPGATDPTSLYWALGEGAEDFRDPVADYANYLGPLAWGEEAFTITDPDAQRADEARGFVGAALAGLILGLAGNGLPALIRDVRTESRLDTTSKVRSVRGNETTRQVPGPLRGGRRRR